MDTATRDYLLEHHREIYKSQSERTDKIYGRFSFLVTPFTILGGGLLFVFGNYEHGWTGPKSLLFYVPFSLSLVAFLVALSVAFYCLARGFDYLSIRRPRVLQKDVEKIAAYAAVTSPPLNVLDDVKTALMERYCEAADYNFEINYRRAKMLLRATQLAIISGLLLLLCVPSVFPKKSQRDASTQTIVLKQTFIDYGRNKRFRGERRGCVAHSCPAHSASRRCPVHRCTASEHSDGEAHYRSEYAVDRGD